MSVSLGTGDDDSCGQVMNCVGSNLGPGMTYDDGEHDIYVNVSSDTGNQTSYGTDDGIFTPPTVVTAGTATTVTGSGTPSDPYIINSAPEIGDTAMQAGDGVTVTGAGIAADPYVVSASPSYAVSQLSEALVLTATGRHRAPLALTATTSVVPNGDVVDNGDGTVTIQRAGTYYLSVTPRYEAGSTGPGCVYVFLMAGGASRAWGGLTVPDTSSRYSLGYVMAATYSAEAGAVVEVQGQRTTNAHDVRLVVCDLTIMRLGPNFPVALQAPEEPYIPELDM
ncbi:hypothetical protein ACIRLA_46385 [Streptomyces sp. NPDC102364]|uniref:hypothetical protein n=1 Tax=Streptomyces sp. NPDC102364 TaxID=3366161 RepID=UPI0038110D37